MNKTVSIKFDLFKVLFYVAIVAAILFFIDSCKRNFAGGLFGGSKTDTISVKSDTVWMVAHGDTVYVPEVRTLTNTNTIYKPLYRTDTLEVTEVLPADTAAIMARFYQKAFYSDTVSNSDTVIRKYGYVLVNDSVHQNRITYRRVITSLKFPEVTNTVTLQKNKIVIYMGASVMGTPTAPLYAVGGDLSLKSVNGKIYTVGAMSTKDGHMYYVAGLKAPIRLRKRIINQ